MNITAKIGYEGLHPRLSEGKRKKLWEAIVQKGLKAYLDRKYNWWLGVD
ncbi:hypothetical protein [Sphingobacterium paludis]|nr:hypothetical protein [Sphingobacterium paludis]